MPGPNKATRAVLDRMLQAVSDERARKQELQYYAEGRSEIKGLNSRTYEELKSDHDRVQYLQFKQMAHLNMCPLMVDSVVNDMSLLALVDTTNGGAETSRRAEAPREELEIEGGAPVPVQQVRTAVAVAQADPEDRDERDRISTEAARRIRDQHLMTVFKRITTEALHHGDGYGMVDATGRIIRLPTMDTYVETDALDPYNRLAAIVSFGEPGLGNNRVVAFVKDLKDGRIFRFEKTGSDDWEVFTTPFTRIPIVRMGPPDEKGLYEDHLATIDRINFLLFSRLVVTDKQSFRELWLKGLPLFYEDDKGEKVPIVWEDEMLKGPGSANVLPGVDSDIKETAATDFSPITSAIFSEIKHLAALTSTPLYILDPSAAQQSALGADLADKVHRMKVRTVRSGIGEGLCELMSLSFEATGTYGRVFEPVWAALEDESLSVRAQTAMMLVNLMPLRMIWSLVLQLTPEQIEEAETLLEEARDNPLLVAPGGLGSGYVSGAGVAPEDELNTDIIEGDLSAVDAPSSGVPASGFILSYLDQHGGRTPAADVILAGKRQGYTESSIKTARTRMAHQVKSTRERGRDGRTVNVWTKVQ